LARDVRRCEIFLQAGAEKNTAALVIHLHNSRLIQPLKDLSRGCLQATRGDPLAHKNKKLWDGQSEPPPPMELPGESPKQTDSHLWIAGGIVIGLTCLLPPIEIPRV